MNLTLETIFRRRSIRKYTDQPVELEKLESLLQAAMAAPSAMNCKPWEFVVVTDPDKLAQFRKRLIFGNRNAPAAIVVCGNPSLSANPAARLFWVQDCSIAAENILIAAASLGLGTVWVGVHPVAGFVRVVREIAGLPKHVTPLGLLYVGYPAEEKPARTQYDEKRVHWQGYKKNKRQANSQEAK
ncbi:MAG: nitroreductase family protein [Chloroflexi bacterium]|nr:nitroreductase family protein [Chloroflexota bacterium]